MTIDVPKLIDLDRVGYRIGQAALLSDVSFGVAARETVMLLGRSGSGKTTALRLINRLLTPTSGRVLVEGRPTTDWDPIRLRRRIGYVIQSIGLFPHFTVERNIGLVPELEGWPSEQVRAAVESLLEKVGLPEETLGRYPHQLSGGQRQRVGVARALAGDPPILLMDEPFGALDPITRRELQREFLAMQDALGKAIVFVTHDVREALLLGHRIGVLEGGHLIWWGTGAEFQASEDGRIAGFREGL
jgi:osmoprotectant transport system ATP-binding protein